MAHDYLYNSIAASTRETYSAGFKSYKLFATTHSIAVDRIMPATISSVVLWITWLAGVRQLSYKTIKNYLAGLAATSIELGYDDPVKHRMAYQVLRGVKRTNGVKSRQTRLPITAAIIRTIMSGITRQQRSFEHKLTFAAMCAGTFGLLRAGEFVHTGGKDDTPLTLTSCRCLTISQHQSIYTPPDRSS